MEKKEMDVEVIYLSPYMKLVMQQLMEDKKYPAVHIYKSALNSFTRYSEEDNKEMSISRVFTRGNLKGYENWLRRYEASWNTVSTYMRTLQAVYNRLVAQKLLPYEADLFDDVYTKVESQTKRALTEEQMNTLLCTDAETLPEELQCVLAYFLLMFMFRGMPFIDIANLRRQDIKGNYIVYCRHKTGRTMVLRIPREARALLEKYRQKHPNSGYLFPILHNAPEDSKEQYDFYQKTLSNFNRKLAALAALLLPGVKVSSYTARHTWATVAYHHNVAAGIISRALGHSSIKVTETYLKPFEYERIDQVNDEIIHSVYMYKKEAEVA